MSMATITSRRTGSFIKARPSLAVTVRSDLRHESIAELRSCWRSINQFTLHVREGLSAFDLAPATAAVLVPGLVISSLYMVPTARRLAAYRPVYSPDLPGFGLSDKPAYALTIAQLADSLHELLDVLRLERPALVGNSFGCQIIVELAARHPSRLGCAVLAAPSIDRYARRPLAQIGRGLLDLLLEKPSLTLAQLRDFYQAGLLRAWRTFQYALADRLEEKLAKVVAPTLVIRGGCDPLASQRWCEEVAALLPRGRLLVMPGAPHALNYSRPGRFVDMIERFISECETPPSPSLL